jgi:L-seryl-tRNA(Ser) seleniumtransferase
MKVGREQIAGLVTAVDRYVNAPGEDDRDGLAELDILEARLRGHSSATVTRGFEESLDVPVLHLDLSAAAVEIDTVIRALAAGEPAIAVGEDHAWRGVITVNPLALLRGDGERFAETFAKTLDRLVAERGGAPA